MIKISWKFSSGKWVNAAVDLCNNPHIYIVTHDLAMTHLNINLDFYPGVYRVCFDCSGGLPARE